MSAPGRSALERRCRVLLRAYPAGYRRERGEEILGTVLDKVPPGRNWPAPREAGGLVLGGLRARAAQGQREGSMGGLRRAALLGVVLALAPHIAFGLATFTVFQRPPLVWMPASEIAESVLFFALAVAAVAAGWLWRPRAGAVLALGAAPAWYLLERGASAGARWPVIIGLAVFALLAWGADRPLRSWLALPAVVIALQMAVYAENISYPPTPLDLALAELASIGFWIIIIAVALWIAVDARPALAVAMALAVIYAPTEMLDHWYWTAGRAWPLLMPWAIAACLAVAAIWRLRRHQARI